MMQMMVSYTVTAERAEDNEALVRRVYDELHEKAPDGCHYATFVLDDGGDGVSFVHVLRAEGDRESSPLLQIEAFEAFRAEINERVVVTPVGTPLREIGSYRFWGA